MRSKYAHMIESVAQDSDGYWIHLRRGFQIDGDHSIVEDTRRKAESKLFNVKTCRCKSCCPQTSDPGIGTSANQPDSRQEELEALRAQVAELRAALPPLIAALSMDVPEYFADKHAIAVRAARAALRSPFLAPKKIP